MLCMTHVDNLYEVFYEFFFWPLEDALSKNTQLIAIDETDELQDIMINVEPEVEQAAWLKCGSNYFMTVIKLDAVH